jgi:hypothetical protein
MLFKLLFLKYRIMKTKVSIAVVLLLVAFSCSEDGEVTSQLTGKWAGNKADFKVNPDGIIPAFTISEDEFPVQLDFRSDGTLVVTDDDGATTSGTYALSERNLTININYTIEMIGLDGTYHVEELTDNSLRLRITKEGEYTHPDTNQQFEGEVEATLYFDRQSN